MDAPSISTLLLFPDFSTGDISPCSLSNLGLSVTESIWMTQSLDRMSLMTIPRRNETLKVRSYPGGVSATLGGGQQDPAPKKAQTHRLATTRNRSRGLSILMARIHLAGKRSPFMVSCKEGASTLVPPFGPARTRMGASFT